MSSSHLTAHRQCSPSSAEIITGIFHELPSVSCAVGVRPKPPTLCSHGSDRRQIPNQSTLQLQIDEVRGVRGRFATLRRRGLGGQPLN